MLGKEKNQHKGEIEEAIDYKTWLKRIKMENDYDWKIKLQRIWKNDG